MDMRKPKPKVTAYTLRGDLETVRNMMDSPQFIEHCRLHRMTQSYWEGKDCLRLEVFLWNKITKVCALYASVSEETLTLIADEEGHFPFILKFLIDRIPNGALFSEQSMQCVASNKD